jgi:hypothetical protein
MIYKRITQCRLCKSNHLTSILSLGSQCLTGIFPSANGPDIESGPLELFKCEECHLVQLADNYDLSKLYGDNYGYRSGLNQSMVAHLKAKAEKILVTIKPNAGDIVLDIGSNDGTTLGAYQTRDLQFIGMDPSGTKFEKYYKSDITLIPDFFSATRFSQIFGSKKAKIITSIAMFYDLEDPIDFAKQIGSILHEDGIWVFEQSYLPFMMEAMAYDTICHEHLEYYSLYQIKLILEQANLKLIDVEFNKINGGSFSVTAGHKSSQLKTNEALISKIIRDEESQGYRTLELYNRFSNKTREHRDQLISTVKKLKENGARIHGYGASTKGNVILQYCGFNSSDLEVIAEVNEEKFGKVTPGTKIPITSESASKKMNPSHYLVLPWHFREGIVAREQEYIKGGGKLLFPLPEIGIFPT